MTINVGARWLALPLLGAAVALVLAGTAQVATVAEASPALQDGSTTVAISPASTQLQCDETATVDIMVNDVEGLYGVDVRVSYDPNVLEAVDALPTSPGIQIAQGDLPDVSGGQGLVTVNSVDPSSGTISYAATRLNPAEAQSGSGVIASITFRGLAAGTSPIGIASVMLSDRTARAISATPVDGEATVTCDGSSGPTATPTTPSTGPTATPVPGGPTPVPGGDDCIHIVKRGETLYSIARNYGTTVAAIQSANKLANPNLIYVGQQLVIPGCKDGGDGTVPPPSGDCFEHIVKPGETLSSIARNAGDSVSAIAKRNGVVNPNLIYVGQSLTICPSGVKPPPPGGKCRVQHVVKPGERLFRIGIQYGVSVSSIQAANNIANPNLIFPGQTLCIP